jgi:predicted MPP superfamily phosphohydrolase
MGSLLPLALVFWSVGVEPGRIVVRPVTVTAAGWPRALDGLRLAVLSDVHTGAPHFGLAQVERVVARVNEQRCDLVVLLGDYVMHGVPGGRFVPPEDTAHALGRLQARLGVVSVLGNHDWWFDGERVRAALAGAGLRPLENETVRIESGGTAFWVAGLADLWTRTPDLGRTLAAVPGHEPILLLTHSPDVFPEVPARVALTLAGHTHGGQVSLPLIGAPVVPSRFGQRYARGLVEEGGRLLFVTPGLGTSIVPVRLGVPPEISLVTLRAR